MEALEHLSWGLRFCFFLEAVGQGWIGVARFYMGGYKEF